MKARERPNSDHMSRLSHWTGKETRALRLASRLSVRAFAERLGMAPRTVSKWEQGGAATRPYTEAQAILDTALAQADDDTKARFALLLEGGTFDREPAQRRGYLSLTDGQLNGHAEHDWQERAADRESWADDLDRVVIYLSRQDFSLASRLLDNWLTRTDPRELDERGLYLRARSLTLYGDMKRDQGSLTGPLSATKSYNEAFAGYRQLHIPRRLAQVELNLTVVTEMAGKLEASARGYELLSGDGRLSARDRARARLWVGTALSKKREHDAAIAAALAAIQLFEQLDESEEWTAAHQKLALAYLNAGDLHRAAQYIDVALTNRRQDSPLQQVRLDTAHAHILLSDRETFDEGLATIERAKKQALHFGLTHQLHAIERIGRIAERPRPANRARRTGKGALVNTGSKGARITEADLSDARLIWDYHQMGHQLRPCSAAIGLGSHDVGVARFAAELYHRGLFPTLVFSGATGPTTAQYFPRGEAVHYQEEAIRLGVPEHAILVEPHAKNTGDNITLSRQQLEQAGVTVESLLLISKPYMERRAYATCRKLWPTVEVVCASEPLSFNDYIASIGDAKLVIDMLVGDLQRVIEYPKLGFAIEQDIPDDVLKAYDRLLNAGYDSRLLKT
jgi:uncharacterized SAM-binding protein YcdF (DUF218 family)/DNA-binding transcriptional regulator YiaG